jgi:hypothetical protein
LHILLIILIVLLALIALLLCVVAAVILMAFLAIQPLLVQLGKIAALIEGFHWFGKRRTLRK